MKLLKLTQEGIAHYAVPFLVVLVVAAVGTYVINESHAEPMAASNSVAQVPLSSYYPNLSNYISYFLNGTNYANSSNPSASVLWFQKDPKNANAFYQYNSGPSSTAATDQPSKATDTCNWDLLTWESTGLTYGETSNNCGSNDNQIVYSPGVVFMPVDYTTIPYTTIGGWQASGSSKAVYTDNGKVTCSGTNSWSSKNMGVATLTGTEQTLWFQNNQSTKWTSGYDASTGCGVINGVDQVTTWQENFYLTQTLPISGSGTPNGITDYALAREVGGNVSSYQSTGHWNYDVWFNKWTPLP